MDFDTVYLRIVTFLLAANFAVWAALMWFVFHIDWYDTAPRWYHGWGWAIWLVALGVVLFIERVVARNFWRNAQPNVPLTSRDKIGKVGNVVAGLLGVILPFVCLYRSGLLEYNTPQWSLDTGYNSSLTAPGFALFGNYNDAASATFSNVFNVSWTKCRFPQWSTDLTYSCNPHFSNATSQLQSTSYGQPVYFTFYTTSMANSTTTTYTNGTNRLLLQAGPVSWNLTKLQVEYNQTDQIQSPVLYALFYDPSLAADDLSMALDCGTLAWTEIPAFDSTTMTIQAKLTTDTLNLVQLANSSVQCQNFTTNLYSKGYMTYDVQMSHAGVTNISRCDISTNPVDYGCYKQIIIRYGSFVVPSMTSKPGIKPTDILVNIAGIVGGVAWVLWFFTVFA